jgi:class 3 adenylate cyclase
VAERFSGELWIGIGINTGVVIAGTIGGGGKLGFTLIRDTGRRLSRRCHSCATHRDVTA